MRTTREHESAITRRPRAALRILIETPGRRARSLIRFQSPRAALVATVSTMTSSHGKPDRAAIRNPPVRSATNRIGWSASAVVALVLPAIACRSAVRSEVAAARSAGRIAAAVAVSSWDSPRSGPRWAEPCTPTIWHRLMHDEFGFERYGAHGSDIGAGDVTLMPRGGHFAAYEEPDLLAADITAFLSPIMSPTAT